MADILEVASNHILLEVAVAVAVPDIAVVEVNKQHFSPQNTVFCLYGSDPVGIIVRSH